VTVIDCMHEAANSIASGMPSRRWQISTTALCGVSDTPRATIRARSMNSEAAEESSPVSTSNDGTGQGCSYSMRSPSRLVARILTVSDRARIASIM